MYEIRPLRETDAPAVLRVYGAAATTGTLGRDADEFLLADVKTSLRETSSDGLCLGAFDGDRLIGVLRAVRLRPRRFRHVVSGVTAAVDPVYQGQGIGRALFAAMLDWADRSVPPVSRVELMLQAGNPGAERLYASLGFVEEGRLRRRVRNPEGAFIDDIFMARLSGEARQGSAGAASGSDAMAEAPHRA